MKKEKDYLKKTHQHRDDLIGEHVYGDIGQLIFLVIFLIVWIADSFIFSYSIFLTQYISNFIRVPIALIILIMAGLLARAGLNTVFGKKREERILLQPAFFLLYGIQFTLLQYCFTLDLFYCPYLYFQFWCGF